MMLSKNVKDRSSTCKLMIRIVFKTKQCNNRSFKYNAPAIPSCLVQNAVLLTIKHLRHHKCSSKHRRTLCSKQVLANKQYPKSRTSTKHLLKTIILRKIILNCTWSMLSINMASLSPRTALLLRVFKQERALLPINTWPLLQECVAQTRGSSRGHAHKTRRGSWESTLSSFSKQIASHPVALALKLILLSSGTIIILTPLHPKSLRVQISV